MMLSCVCRIVAREILRGCGEVARIVRNVNVGVCCVNVARIVGRAVTANKRSAVGEHIIRSDSRAPIICNDGCQCHAKGEHVVHCRNILGVEIRQVK